MDAPNNVTDIAIRHSFRNHIVAEEKPDSSATIIKIRVNVLILAILADKMAFSLTTMNLRQANGDV